MQELMRKRTSERPLRRMLFGYMMLLAAILLFSLLAGLFLIGRFGSVRERIYESLDIQMQVFAKEILGHYDELSFRTIQLSEDMAEIVEDHFAAAGSGIAELTDSPAGITALETALFDPLRQRMLQAECSGAFVLLDATINSEVPNSDFSRSGIYLQPSDSLMSEADVLLYRGIADVGQRHGAMVHRKWRQEFDTAAFPNYGDILALAKLPADEAYRLTDLFTLPGTSERATLMAAPITGSGGELYGICGFEISESYFKLLHSQASGFDRLTCLIAGFDESVLFASSGLSSGITNGYHFPPRQDLTISAMPGGLLSFTGESSAHVGLMRMIPIYRGDSAHAISVMIPRADYDRDLFNSILQLVFLLILLLFFTVSCCMLFSRRFLNPLLQGLERLKDRSSAPETSTMIPEIDDLFHFLAAQDREHEEAISRLERETQLAASEHTRMQAEYAAAQTELSRLAYERNKEIDPIDYQLFVEGMRSLTPAEERVFHCYLEGRSSKEILEIMTIKESTLRYHNRNIYQKLGVNSLKQMLRYGALVRHKENQ